MNLGAIHSRRPLVEEGGGLLILRCFWMERGGGVPLVYDVTNKKMNRN